MMNIQQITSRCPVIPVLTLDKLEHAVPLAQALCAGGLRVLEITLRTDVGLDAIRAIVRAVPEAIVGVGTVVSSKQLMQAQALGAGFAVSPGFTPELGKTAASLGLAFLPGVFSPSEVIAAQYYGYDVLKLYPAALAGGTAMLKTLAAPFPHVKLCPSGGVTPELAAEWLSMPNVACVCGSWLTPSALLETGDWDGIRQLALDTCTRINQTSDFVQ